MGMDISGLNPKLKGVEPKFPDNYDALSEEDQKAYLQEHNDWLDNNPGFYFRANLWGWRPIAELCIHAIENSGLDFGDIALHYNSGDGLKTQEDCDLLANALEYVLEEEDNIKEDDDLIYLNLGMWKKMGSREYVTEEKCNELNEKCIPGGYTGLAPRIMFTGGVVDDNGDVYIPSHSINYGRIKSFITFLRNSGGFAIWQRHMSVEYCDRHHHYFDTDWVEECQMCAEEEEQCIHCGAQDTSYKGYCSRACYLYDLE